MTIRKVELSVEEKNQLFSEMRKPLKAKRERYIKAGWILTILGLLLAVVGFSALDSNWPALIVNILGWSAIGGLLLIFWGIPTLMTQGEIWGGPSYNDTLYPPEYFRLYPPVP